MQINQLLLTWALLPIVVLNTARQMGCRPSWVDRYFGGTWLLLTVGLATAFPGLRAAMAAGNAAAITLGFGVVVVATHAALTPGAFRLMPLSLATVAVVDLAMVVEVQLRLGDGWSWLAATATNAAVTLGAGWGTAWLLSRLRGTARRDSGPPPA